MLLQVPDLVPPLGHNPYCVLQEGYDNQEATNGRQMGFQWLGINFNVVLHLLADCAELFEWVIGVGCAVA